jgi:pyruvate dehydrogenase E2 component (dihydrolipoamide acetyltransferase)
MPKIMLMPKVGVNMTDALIVKWMVKEGDVIKYDQHIMDAETDKAVQEINATAEGVVVKLLADELERVACQQPLLILAEPEEKVDPAYINKFLNGSKKDEDQGSPVRPDPAVPPGASGASHETSASAAPSAGRVKISPLAKKIARDMGIDYRLIPPARPGARIVKADVLAYSGSVSSAPSSLTGSAPPSPAGSKIPFAGVRKIVADKMTESVLTKPSVALTLHADASALVSWRERLKKNGRGVRYDAILVAIAAKALREFPIMNSRLEEDGICCIEDINIGVAVDTEKGLMVPVIHNADKKGIAAINGEIASKAQLVKEGRAGLKDITGGTFTVTNLGLFGIEQFDAIINPPECCILAVGAIVKEPVVKNDEIVVGSRMQLTLAFDHRIVDGAPAARFLHRIKCFIEDPMELLS